jgi:E3 ubiquitin-protein ligase RGLG
VLLILCDGQVTSERETTEAIVEARYRDHVFFFFYFFFLTCWFGFYSNTKYLIFISNYPLSIVVIGVGDGPWDDMINFDDNLPERKVDNLQFVDSAAFLRYNEPITPEIEAKFALAALQELPEHYAQCRKLKML